MFIVHLLYTEAAQKCFFCVSLEGVAFEKSASEMASLAPKHFVFVVALLCMATFSCKGTEKLHIYY